VRRQSSSRTRAKASQPSAASNEPAGTLSCGGLRPSTSNSGS
jgi:hypothetical protein